MRGFAQTLFNALLGWIRMLVEGVWGLLFSNDTQQWLQWVADNWLTLVILLCLCGVVLDYLIWLLRWRPYYVWASSMRRVRRFFGGGKARKEGKEPYQNPRPLPVQQYAQEEAFQEDAPEEPEPFAEIWEDPAFSQPETAFAKTPAATADTIMARPRKADYQEQYVRRFARPEAEVPAAPPMPEETFGSWDEPPVSREEPQEELWPREETDSEAENWAQDAPAPSLDQPLHPGIDYQALSRKYGWHQEVQAQREQTPDEPADEPQEQQGPSWNFSGLENFSPYRAPAPPGHEQRSERARKARTDGTPLSRVKSGLSRIAQRAGKVLTVDDEEAGKLIDGLPPPIDKRRAFHAPVYPNRPGETPGKNPDFQKDD